MKRFIAIGLLIFFTFSCSTVPITGRKQFSLIPNSQLLPMSFSSYNEVKQTAKLSTNAEQTAMIKRVGANIQHAVERYMKDNGLANQLAGFAWEFNLIEDDQVNAWCMPGGKVAFYTGILPICKDEKGVAVVMGHEVAHAIANHGGGTNEPRDDYSRTGGWISNCYAKQASDYTKHLHASFWIDIYLRNAQVFKEPRIRIG